MSFQSLAFLIFFPLTVLVYFSLPKRMQWLILLLAGMVFYAWAIPQYLPLILLIIAITYACGRLMDSGKRAMKPWAFSAAILIIILTLVAFKYSGFILENLNRLTGIREGRSQNVFLNLIIPLGLSYQSFMAISYLIEVSRGNIRAEKHPGIFALYLLFFPVILAGPIERPQHLIPQLHERHFPKPLNFTTGLRLMLWGFFKKLVVADNLAPVVDQVYANPAEQNGLTWMIATLLFSFQLYFDFSAYTHIAIGAARILGFRITENFNEPYRATSVTDFWRRWHISLSTWLRDYIFTPLSVRWRNAGRFGGFAALLLTFLLCGFWHEAGWAFIAWGGIHGLIMGVESFVLPVIHKKRKRKGKQASVWSLNTSMLLTFSMVMFSWVFFRSGSLELTMRVFSDIALTSVPAILDWSRGASVLGGLGRHSVFLLAVLALAIILVLLAERGINRPGIQAVFHRYAWLRWIIYFILFYSTIFLGNYGETVFIYARF